MSYLELLSDELLRESYEEAVKLDLSSDFIRIFEMEMTERKISIKQEYY